MKLGTLNLENMYVLAPIMSITVLKGSLETITLLIFLRHDNYITSRKIREKFKNTSSGTLYMRLKKLIYQGLLLKLTKKGNFAGDDRTEYKLSEKGLKVRKDLIDYNITILNPTINLLIKEKTLSRENIEVENKNERVQDFIMEFSEEISDMVNNESIIKLQKIIEKLLKKYF